MKETERRVPAGHLTDDELFGLALPPAGQPEALPAHLLDCSRCGRALQEWKSAVQQLGDEEVEPIAARSPDDWRAAEDRTLEALRRAGTRRRFRPLPWAAAIAASLLLAILLLPARRSESPAPAPLRASSAQPPELSPQDADDDRLLQEVAQLSRGEDGVWDGLDPDPGADGGSL